MLAWCFVKNSLYRPFFAAKTREREKRKRKRKKNKIKREGIVRKPSVSPSPLGCLGRACCLLLAYREYCTYICTSPSRIPPPPAPPLAAVGSGRSCLSSRPAGPSPLARRVSPQPSPLVRCSSRFPSIVPTRANCAYGATEVYHQQGAPVGLPGRLGGHQGDLSQRPRLWLRQLPNCPPVGSSH
ncbi:hypothetical protein GQ53DRAFT_72284 [Thozetella sp. PMI_491]|nr:hypothetical protein GQ53DRAFT_72284 [Thozetella sp. PMI_491]